jgi:hypothetical protein
MTRPLFILERTMTCGRLIGCGLLLMALAGRGLAQDKDRLRRSSEVSHGPGSRSRTPGLVFVTLPSAPVTSAGILAASGYYGDHIIHIGDGGNEAVRLYGVRNVGFKFTVVSLACFHLWTWGGTYCVYEPVVDGNRLSDKYTAISRPEAARLLGKQESDLTTPFWYRFPPGYLLLLTFVFVGVISALVRWIRKPRPPVHSTDVTA